MKNMINKIKDKIEVIKEVWKSEELTKVLETAREKINCIEEMEKKDNETLKTMEKTSKEYNKWQKKLLRKYVIEEITRIYKKKEQENKGETRLTIFDF